MWASTALLELGLNGRHRFESWNQHRDSYKPALHGWRTKSTEISTAQKLFMLKYFKTFSSYNTSKRYCNTAHGNSTRAQISRVSIITLVKNRGESRTWNYDIRISAYTGTENPSRVDLTESDSKLKDAWVDHNVFATRLISNSICFVLKYTS